MNFRARVFEVRRGAVGAVGAVGASGLNAAVNIGLPPPPPPHPPLIVVLRAILGRMQFTLHATRQTRHGASRLVQAMSAWLVKTRRAPSRHIVGMRWSMAIRLRPCTN